ncbi:HNH endonuclease [Microbacterium sp. NPDC058342]|uniref:HNH endonuclease signature motif containing protein n=1 Tax=Microbacterium sp. NPDC058342 TaxID=3346454 RepID=UPI003661E809
MDADVAETPMHRDAIWRSMVAEFSAAGKIAKGSVEHAFGDARLLHEVFPALRASFAAGDVTGAHVREIVRAAAPLLQAINEGAVDADRLRLFEAGALDFAEAEAPARTRAHVRELAAALAPQTVLERHRAALDEQFVSVRPRDDDMGLLMALLPMHQAVAIMERLTAQAREIKDHPTVELRSDDPELMPDGSVDSTAIFGIADTYTVDPFHPGGCAFEGTWVPATDPLDDPQVAEAYDRALAIRPDPLPIPQDPRSLGRIRAELLIDQLLTAAPSDVFGADLAKITAHVQVTVAATTLAGHDDRPAQLDGHGPLDPDIARGLAGSATSWTRLFLDADGFVTHTDTYVPTAGMRRYLRARDQHCRFPGCRMPVHRCETDHTHDHARGGATSITNLAHLCRTHHALKHPDIPDEHRWSARQRSDGVIEWIGPDGATHLDRPPRRVMFVPSEPEATPNTAPPGPADWAALAHDAPF